MWSAGANRAVLYRKLSSSASKISKKVLTMVSRRLTPNFLPQEAYGISPYKYTGTGQEQADIPLGLQYKQGDGDFVQAFPGSALPAAVGPVEQPGISSLPAQVRVGDYGTPPSFTLSELSQDALNFLKQKTGKEISIKPLNIFQKMAAGGRPEELMGMYQGRQYGETPNQRTIFINQDNPAGLGTLFHEAGHAVDSNLKQQTGIQRGFNPEYINRLSRPGERLNYLFETTGFPQVVKETEAQRFAGENLNEFQQQQQNKNKTTFDSKVFTDNPNYKFYPGSYAGETVGKFFNVELPGRQPLQQPLNPGSDTYGYDATGSTTFQPPTAEKGVALGTDSDLWRTQEQIMQKTRDYIDPLLNQYMTNPTPAFETFWSSK